VFWILKNVNIITSKVLKITQSVSVQ